MVLPALAADQQLLTPLPGGKPRLAKLEIEIWPEYDRQAALVLLKGELPTAGQSISLRIPASTGGPHAVAQSTTEGGNLLNLPYDRSDAKDYVTIRMQPADRFFQVEFYDKLDTSKDKREYRYSWPGDLAVDQVSVHVQQPALATDFAITPEITESAAANDGFIYWTKNIGAAPAGKALPITIRYTKSDARTSKDIVASSSASSAPANAPAPSPAISDSPSSDSGVGAVDPRTYLFPAMFGVAIAAVAAVFLLRRRKTPDRPAQATGFCTKCGNPLRAEDRFCSKCGAKTVSGERTR
jgi:hypothetical protein